MTKFVARCATVVVAATLLFATITSAQSDPLRRKALQRLVDVSDKLTLSKKAMLSSGMRNFLRTAKRALALPTTAKNPLTAAASGPVDSTVMAVPTTTSNPNGVIPVSNPKHDFTRSVLGGFRQTTSSSARCGNSVVVGFYDNEDFLPSLSSPIGSVDGVSVSSDGGQSFADLGFLGGVNVPPNPDFLAGDPVLACSSPARFYYASLIEVVTFDQGDCLPGCPFQGVSVSVSDNAGNTWADPVTAVLFSGFDHTIDRPWLAVDPSNPQRLYLTYTDMQAANFFNPCIPGSLSIDLITSADGGNTWSAPTIVHQECPDWNTGISNLPTGANVVASPNGQVYVAYELFQQSFGPVAPIPPQILFQRSLDHGQTFSNPLKVSDVAPIGVGALWRTLQGLNQADELPMLAVDRSAGPSRGTLYVAWSDGRDNIRPDLISGAYAYSDVFVAKSRDSGSSFTALGPISPTPPTFRGKGRDQFLPSIAVDRNGEVAVCYYDRRNDRTNMAIDRYCSVSSNQGLSWQDLRASSPSWVPLNIDPLQYLLDDMVGTSFFSIFAVIDYDTLTTDFLLTNDGFFGAFELQVNGNPDIVATKF
jgi:BNR repeat-like domain